MEKIFDRFLPIKRDDGQVLRGIRQYETAPVVRLHLIGEDGEGVDIGGCDAVSLTLARPDGVAVARTLSVNSVICMAPAVIEVAFADGVYTAVSGLCELALDVYSGGLRMTSARMRYIVEPAIEVSDGDVEADAGYSMFLEAMSDLSVLYGEVKTSEGLRVTAESERAAAENERSDAEALRVSAEEKRGSAEKARISGEATRGSAEAARASAENARVSAENARVSAENARGSSEGLRASAETVRARAEVGRADAESARVSAETERASAEGLRASAENARADAESARVSAEASRTSAEAKRVSAEDERVASEVRREQAMRELIEDVVAATGCKVFDIDMGQYGFGDPEVGETYYLDSGISIPNVRLGDFAFDTVAGYIYKCVRKAEADAIVGDGFLCAAALGGSSGGGGGFRKIGFTADCDFVATEDDGLTAFRGALNAATDGETILVMPGVYKGTERFDVTKNIDFVGIGKPEINFPIWISGGGVFSYENWAWETVYDSITSKWDGFRFTGDFTVGLEANPDNQGYSGKAILSDCDLVGNSVTMCGSAKNCTFDVVAFTSGHYYGAGDCCTEFDDCIIKASGSFDASSCFDRFIRCDIYPISGNTYISTEWYDIKTFVGSKMYALGTSLSLIDSHSNTANLNDTIVFANSVSGTSGGYLVNPTAL